jgi:hypothetical protein
LRQFDGRAAVTSAARIWAISGCRNAAHLV